MSEAFDRARELGAQLDRILELVDAELPPVFVPAEAKPVGPYATFGECVGAMRRRDYSEEEARRICGSMESQARKAAGPKDVALLRRLLRATRKPQAVFEAAIRRALEGLGERAAKAWRELKDDEITVELVIRAADVEHYPQAAFAGPWAALYRLVGEATFQAASERMGVDVGWMLDDPAAIAVVEAGGRRLGLVDLRDDTRRALFAAIADAREAGEGPVDLARRIRRYVPAGRFTGLEAERPGRGVAYRSELIARTETTFARNVSALAAGGRAGFDRYVVFDARIGPTDGECEALNGEVVDAAEAARLIETEHPNGTRSVSPLPRSRV